MKLSIYPIPYVAQRALQRLLYLCSKQYRIEVEAFFEAIKAYNYVVVKLDTPNKHRRFPLNYKIGTDIDVIVLEEDLHKIKDVIITLNKNKKLKKVVSEKEGKLKVRYQFSKFLNLQFDLISSQSNDLYVDCLKMRSDKNLIKTPLIEYEIVVRALEFQRRPSKIYHLEFIQRNNEFVNVELLKKYEIKSETIKMINNN